MPRVAFIRPELAKMLPRYKKIRDCLSGSEAVKNAGELYLPKPNPDDKSKANEARYNSYRTRAVFYNVTARTLDGLVGQVFSRAPVSEIPDSMDVVEADATGDGVSLEQLAEGTLRYTLSYGRSGLLVDFPNTEGSVTAADIQSGRVRPVVSQYDPSSIINWRYRTIGSVKQLIMVNLAEAWPYHDDGFEIKTACQFRVLEINAEGNYTVTIWREASSPTDWTYEGKIPSNNNYVIKEGPIVVTGPDGLPLKDILFKFVGVRNNDGSIDNPPLYSLADLNIAHYRNSADYEEACYQLGQPTYWFAGLTEDWVKKILGDQIQLGSRGGVLLPAGGSAGLLQPEPNTMCKEAMDAKERQMVALGAKLVEQKTVQRTATEANQDNASETSILASAAKNVSKAYEWALGVCATFLNIGDVKLSYKLNSDFQMMQLTPADRLQLMKEIQAGSITFGEMRAVLRKSGIATEDDTKAAETIATEQAASLALVAKSMAAETAPNNAGE